MSLRHPVNWVWDFWFAQDGPDYHVFYLQAPRSLGREDQRHWHVSIGHAVSQDLRSWEILPDALHPTQSHSREANEAFDSYTTWTGSIVRHDGRWYLLYTGSRRSEKGLIQRIGLATSGDLMIWQKHPDSPLICADPQWYELLNLSAWHDQAWRDPWVFQHPESGEFHALITARTKDGPADARGVIGHAQSRDLIHWDVLPPLTKPGEFGHMEVPQLAAINGRYYLLFSVPRAYYSLTRKERMRDSLVTGTHYLVADDPLGPYRYLTDSFMCGDEIGSLYSGKVIQGPDGGWNYLAFRNFGPDGEFVGELSDPMPVSVENTGELSVLVT